MTRKIFGAVLFLVCAGVVPQAWGSCGSAVCPLDTQSAFEMEKGRVRFGYEFEYIDQDQPRIGTRKASVGEIHGHHDEQRTLNRTHRLLGSYGVTDRLEADLVLPFVSRHHEHIHTHHGARLIEAWDFSGVGDLAVQARCAWYKPAQPAWPTLSTITGVEFPTGKSHVVNDAEDEAEPGITPGSASYDFIIGGVSFQQFGVPTMGGSYGMMPIFVSGTYKINGKGHDDYKLGNILSVNVGTIYPVQPRVGVIGQLNLLVKERDDEGDTHEEVGKTGGEYLYVSPGLRIQITSHLECSAVVQIPVYQRVNQIELTADVHLLTNVSYRFKI